MAIILQLSSLAIPNNFQEGVTEMHQPTMCRNISAPWTENKGFELDENIGAFQL